MAFQSVQFKSIDDVLTAFQSRNVAAWSIWQGKQFMFKHEGADMAESATQLEAHLELLQSSTNAIYTLKIYEDLPAGGKIKSNTADDGSFNFRLNLESQEITREQYSRHNNNQAVLEHLTEIKSRLAALEASDNDEDEDEDGAGLGQVGKLLNHPVIGGMIQGFLGNLLPSARQQPATRLAGLPEENEAAIQNALAVLKSQDPQLSEHLAKLATLSLQNPGQFNFLLKTLDSL